jgi:sugar phosphate permease
MTLDTLIMLSGAFVAVLPFLGFPNSWDTALFFLAGIFIIALGIVVRRRGADRPGDGGTGHTPDFVESASRSHDSSEEGM